MLAQVLAIIIFLAMFLLIILEIWEGSGSRWRAVF